MKVEVAAEALIIKVTPVTHIPPREYLLSRKEVGRKYQYEVVSIDPICGERMLGREDTTSFLATIAKSLYIYASKEAMGDAVWEVLSKRI